MAKDILFVTTSSVPSERLFSEAPEVLSSKKECSLSDSSLKELIYVNTEENNLFKPIEITELGSIGISNTKLSLDGISIVMN